MPQQVEREQLWQQLVDQIGAEYHQLEVSERTWIQKTCDRISCVQERLDQLFRRGDGLRQCQDCRGDCCALGHNHLTLANLLLFLSQDVRLPTLDFSSTCPLLGTRGCLLAAGQRPYNCISFLCDRIEDQLQKSDVECFYLLEKELRAIYRMFADRYAGGSMSGLLLTAKRLRGQPYLKRIDLC